MPRLLSIIIPAWRGSPSGLFPAEALLDSIQENLTLPHEVIVVCNSQDSHLANAVRTNPIVTRYCLNSTNVGVARAWNMGSQMAEGDILCYVNEDVLLGRDCLETLVRTLDALEDVGVIGVEGANVDIDAKGMIRTDARITGGPPQYCDIVSGFLFLLKTEVYYQIGGFDNQLTPCSYEEFDLAFRVRDAGYRCYVVPSSSYHHVWGVSTAAAGQHIQYMGHRDSVRAINRRNQRHFASSWAHRLPFAAASTGAAEGTRSQTGVRVEAGGREPGEEWPPPVPSSLYTREYYLAEAAGYQEFGRSGGLSLQPRDGRVFRLAGVQPGQTILDIGCGRGEIVAQSMKAAATAIGVDYAAAAVALSGETIARGRGKGFPGQGLAVLGRGQALPLRDESVDRGTFIDIAEHLHPWELARCLSELWRVLKPGGCIVVHTTPNRWYADLGFGIEGALYRLLNLRSFRGLGWKLPRTDSHRRMHVNELSPFDLHQALSAAGFRVRLSFFPVREEGGKLKRLGRRLVQGTPPLAYLMSSELYACAWKPPASGGDKKRPARLAAPRAAGGRESGS